jgi:hypothetical protein
MHEQSFNSISRRAAAVITRRTSLATLGTAGFALTLAAPFTADAKKRKKSAKNGKKDTKQCKKELAACTTQAKQCAAQVDQCTAIFEGVCGGDPACADQIACCSHLASCDAHAFFACLVAIG